MRKFNFWEWEYALNEFANLSKKKWYVQRMRLEYCFLLTDVNPFKKRAKVYLEYLIGYINVVRALYYYQLVKPSPAPGPNRILAIYSSNHAYLQNIKPVLMALAKEQQVTFLCSAHHLKKLAGKLDQDILAKTTIIESIVYGSRGFIARLFRVTGASLVGLIDGIWFAFRGIKRSASFSSAFCMYSATEYYFGKDIRKYYTADTRIIASSEHWVWESLYMLAAKDKGVRSYILQHGVIGDYSYPLFASKFLSWGTFDKEKMLETFKAAPNEVELIGSPYFDTVYQRVQEYKLTESQFSQPYIVFLGQPLMGTRFIEQGYYEEFLERFYALQPIAEALGKKLLIKMHPADKPVYYDSRPSFVDVSNEPLMEVLAKTCMAVTVDSTSVFEGVMFGVPCYQTGIEGMLRKVDFAASGVCMRENNSQSLYNSVLNLLSKKEIYNKAVNNANDALPKYYFGLGTSIPRILDLLQAGN